MGDIGAPEMLIILVVLLVLFGGAKLPGLARSLGEAKNEFTKALSSDDKKPNASATPETAAVTPDVPSATTDGTAN